jgi:uncharacterized Zn-finger protein
MRWMVFILGISLGLGCFSVYANPAIEDSSTLRHSGERSAFTRVRRESVSGPPSQTAERMIDPPECEQWGVEPNSCDHPGCGKCFNRRSAFKRHTLVHRRRKAFACLYPGCQKRYRDASTLRKHAVKHTGMRPHACGHDGCNKDFFDTSNLNRHRPTHTREKPFACSYLGCRWTFSDASNCNRHQKNSACQKISPRRGPLGNSPLGKDGLKAG